MAPLRRKARRNAGGNNAQLKKKPPPQGRGPPRDLSSRSSGSDSRSRSGSGSGSSDESSSCGDSDEDDPRDYKKGGYHPVMPYQLYNGRYRVLSKLGAGAFSTVWLCADEKDTLELMGGPTLIAMKVCKSKKSVTEQAEDEVALLDRLQEGSVCSPHAVQMNGHFWHSGPNGRHKCMVFEVMGENLLALVKFFDYNGLPVSMVRRLTRHTLLGLEYIHSRGVIHTDVKLENVLVQRHDMVELLREANRAHRAFTEQKSGQEAMSKSQRKRLKKKQKNAEVKGEEAKAEEATGKAEAEAETEALSKSQKKRMKKKKNADAKVEGGDGGGADSDEEPPAKAVAATGNDVNDGDGDESDMDRAAAEACGRPVPPVRQKDRFETLQSHQVFAKLADFGNGCREDRKVTDDIQTRQYRSPEVIIGAPWNETADMWSAACMFFELLTGDFLFDPSTGENWSRNEDHLALMMELLGEHPPKEYALSGKYSRDFFTNAGKLKHIKNLKFWALPDVLSVKYKIKEEEADDIADFLLPMLAWSPTERCSATQALKHFWVQSMPGESDVPDPESFNASPCLTEAELKTGEAAKRDAGEKADAGAAERNAEAHARSPPSAVEVSGRAEVREESGRNGDSPTKDCADAEARDLREGLCEESPLAPSEAVETVRGEMISLESPRRDLDVQASPGPATHEAELAEAKADTDKIALAEAVKVAQQDGATSASTAATPEPAQQLEPTEADTTQDVDEAVAPAAEVTVDEAACTGEHRGKGMGVQKRKEEEEEVAASRAAKAAAQGTACEGDHRGSVEDVMELSALEQLVKESDSVPLVAALESSDCQDVSRLTHEAGLTCRRLDDRHIAVLIHTGASTPVSAAEIAELGRKAHSVSRWMSLEDYKASAKQTSATHCTGGEVKEAAEDEELVGGGDDKPKKKNNKKKGKKT